MLIQPDRLELGDFRLDPKEAVAQKREECLAMAATKRLHGQDELADPLRALGPRIQFGEMLSKLRRITPSLVIKEGSPGSVALYYPRSRKEFDDALRAWQWDRDYFFLKHKYVGGFEKQELQEFSTIDEDNAFLATKEHRGWRTVLISLIQQGCVSYRKVIKEFGDVGTDRRGWRWREALRAYRNNPEVAFQEE
jgi:hypothetical protein